MIPRIEEVDGKPGKHTVDIHGHRKGGAALATVDGKHACTNVPFWQLIENLASRVTHRLTRIIHEIGNS